MDEQKIKCLLLKDIVKTKPLPEHEQIELLKKIKSGDHTQINKLIKSNLKFILQVAFQHKNQNITVPELVSEGVIGMIHAAKRFDLNSKNKFISYAVWWIRQTMVKAINNKTIQIPSNITSNYSRIEKAKEQCLQELGYIDFEYMAEKAKCSITDIKGSFIQQPVSIYSPINDDTNSTIESTLASNEKDVLQQIIKKEECKELMRGLNARQRKIVKMYFGFYNNNSMNLKKIGEHFQISKERVRQLLKKSIKDMKNKNKKKHKDKK